MQEDRLDELLAQLDRLETLHDQGLPVDVSYTPLLSVLLQLHRC